MATWGSVGDDRLPDLRRHRDFSDRFAQVQMMLQTETIWHKCRSPFFPRRTVDGGWTIEHLGQLWRRKRPDGKWEYRQDDETYEDQILRQW